MSTPTGPAGGDLGGTYPNPTVVSLAHVTAGGDLFGNMAAPTVISLGGVTAGGDLFGNMSAPQVVNLSHVMGGGDLQGSMDSPSVWNIGSVTVGPAVYPAGSAALLTNVPAPAALGSANALVLDGTGTAFVNPPTPVNAVIPAWYNSFGVGQLWSGPTGLGNQWQIVSTAAGADAGFSVQYIAF